MKKETLVERQKMDGRDADHLDMKILWTILCAPPPQFRLEYSEFEPPFLISFQTGSVFEGPSRADGFEQAGGWPWIMSRVRLY